MAEAETDLCELVEWAVATAHDKGADEAEAVVTRDQGVSVTARMRDVETLEFQKDRSFGITVFRNKSRASATTADLSRPALEQAIEKACFIAAQTEADPCAGLADAPLMAKNPVAIALDFPWGIDTAAVRDQALACEAAALDFDPAIVNSEGASVSTSRSQRAYANSHAFVGLDARTRHSISCAVITGERDDMERDYHYAIARDPADLPASASVGEEAARRTLARRDPQRIATSSAPVLFSADLARGLFGHAASAMTGSAQYRQSSFLLGAVGKPLFPSWLQWHERPHLDRGLASAAYDAEGVQTRERVLVSDGSFQGYILSSYSARRLKLETTANAGGLHNVEVSSKQGSEEDMLSTLGTGLLVTELMGQGVNPVTGDYSRGAAGFWVENGAVAYPVSEVTIAGNLLDMYAGIEALGSDIDRRGVIQTGSVLIDSMKIAGSDS